MYRGRAWGAGGVASGSARSTKQGTSEQFDVTSTGLPLSHRTLVTMLALRSSTMRSAAAQRSLPARTFATRPVVS